MGKSGGCIKVSSPGCRRYDFISLQDDRNDIRGEAYIFYNFGSKPYYFRMSSIDDHGFEGKWSGTVRFIIKSFSP